MFVLIFRHINTTKEISFSEKEGGEKSFLETKLQEKNENKWKEKNRKKEDNKK